MKLLKLKIKEKKKSHQGHQPLRGSEKAQAFLSINNADGYTELTFQVLFHAKHSD